jgi:hypothetical protein
MRYSVNIPNLGDFADPRVVADTARLAEESGWDGRRPLGRLGSHRGQRLGAAARPGGDRRDARLLPRPQGKPQPRQT